MYVLPPPSSITILAFAFALVEMGMEGVSDVTLTGLMCAGTPADPKTVGDRCPNDGMVPVCCYTIVSFCLWLCLSEEGRGERG